mmetsp:Transcript_46199/g.84626  ORF Transcript_46199/g.84626 Transcript_46199/m.84626 type:complete len:160 (-) Transcript_46199:104-583(-)
MPARQAPVRVTRRLIMLMAVVALAGHSGHQGGSAFIPQQVDTTQRQQVLAGLGSTLVAMPAAHADTVYINPEALRASGLDPSEVRRAIIETQPADVQIQMALTDFLTDIVIPFFLGLGIVYGLALTFGAVDGPFDNGDDEAKKETTSKAEKTPEKSSEK